MKKFLTTSALSLGMLTSLSFSLPTTALASHHFEGAAYLMDSRYAQVDNFIFQSERPNHTAIVMNVNYAPQEGENGTFSPDAIYNIHLSFDKTFTKGITFNVKFDNNKYYLYKLNEPNAAPGTLGAEIGNGIIGKPSEFKDGIKSFAGIIEDPFFGNSTALGKFRAQNQKGIYDPKVWSSVDGNVFKTRIVGSIVLDIPNSMLEKNVYAFFTTDKNENNQWKQVQYSAIPLVSHSLFFADNEIKMKHDQSRPNDDNKLISNIISSNILRNAILAKSQDNPVAYADKTTNIFVPDVIPYKVGTQAKFSEKDINGRSLEDDAMSAVLTLIIGKETDQAIANTKKFTKNFPYVIKHDFK